MTSARPLTRPDHAGHTSVMRRLATRLTATRTALLSTAGFGLLAAAAWIAWGVAPGLAAAGTSILVLEYLADDGKGGTR